MEYLEIEGKTYEVTGHAEDGLPILRAQITTTEDGVDEHGNPKRSVHVHVPAATIGVTPGEVT